MTTIREAFGHHFPFLKDEDLSKEQKTAMLRDVIRIKQQENRVFEALHKCYRCKQLVYRCTSPDREDNVRTYHDPITLGSHDCEAEERAIPGSSHD